MFDFARSVAGLPSCCSIFSNLFRPVPRMARRMAVVSVVALVAVCLCASGARAQTTYYVTSLGDSGTGSGNEGDLRWAITQSNATAGSNYTNRISLIGLSGTITLQSALPTITGSVFIYGSGLGQLTISGNHAFPIFSAAAPGQGQIPSTLGVTISSLTLANGRADGADGGAISNSGWQLAVTVCTFSGNSSNGENGGGAIANGGTMTVSDSTFSGNSALAGGAIANWGNMTVSRSTFSGNSALGGGGYGGAIYNGGVLLVVNSTFFSNSALTGGAIYIPLLGNL
jgi:predicted outer membrane repeat protein